MISRREGSFRENGTRSSPAQSVNHDNNKTVHITPLFLTHKPRERVNDMTLAVTCRPKGLDKHAERFDVHLALANLYKLLLASGYTTSSTTTLRQQTHIYTPTASQSW